MADLKELKEVLDFGLTFAMVTDQKLQDGFQWDDLFALVPVMTKFPAAIDGIDQVDDEIKNMTDADRIELANYVKDLFDIADYYAEQLVEQGLRVGVELSKFVFMLREVRQ